MEVIDTKSIVDGDTYVVWYDFEFNGTQGLFVLHMEGNPKKLVRMMRNIKNINSDIYFCEGLKGIWSNHRKLVGKFTDTDMNIFKFVWKDKDAKHFS